MSLELPVGLIFQHGPSAGRNPSGRRHPRTEQQCVHPWTAVQGDRQLELRFDAHVHSPRLSDMSDTVSVIRVFPPWLLWPVFDALRPFTAPFQIDPQSLPDRYSRPLASPGRSRAVRLWRTFAARLPRVRHHAPESPTGASGAFVARFWRVWRVSGAIIS